MFKGLDGASYNAISLYTGMSKGAFVNVLDSGHDELCGVEGLASCVFHGRPE